MGWGVGRGLGAGPARDGTGSRAATLRSRWPLRCSLAFAGGPGQTLALTLPPGLGLAVSAARYQTGAGDVPGLGRSACTWGSRGSPPVLAPWALGRGPAVTGPSPPVRQRHMALPDRSLPAPGTRQVPPRGAEGPSVQSAVSPGHAGGVRAPPPLGCRVGVHGCGGWKLDPRWGWPWASRTRAPLRFIGEASLVTHVVNITFIGIVHTP